MNTTSTIHFSESTLISGLLNEDQDCFASIYDMHAAKILGMIMKWVKEEKKAEILLHHTFIKAWISKKTFNAENENIYCWLCKMARICYVENK